MKKTTFFYDCKNAAEAMYQVEIYSTCPYRVLETHYFGNAREGKEYADSYYAQHPYDGNIDYEEIYREHANGAWIPVQY